MAARTLLSTLVALWLACAAAARPGSDGQPTGASRRLLALKDGREGGAAPSSLLRPGLSLQEATDARVCALQCLQHACIGWMKVYMDVDEGARPQQAGEVPAAAAECLARCGMPVQEASCLSRTYQRLLNTSPLQFSCSSSCVAGLLHSSCSQCSGGSGASGCHALHLGAATAASECLVDAAV